MSIKMEGDTPSLTNGKEPSTIMFSHCLTGFILNKIPFFLSKMSFDKILEINLPKKTNALAVFSVFVWQTIFLCEFSYLFLLESADRKQGSRKLFLGEISQKIGLILNRIRRLLEIKKFIFLDYLRI